MWRWCADCRSDGSFRLQDAWSIKEFRRTDAADGSAFGRQRSLVQARRARSCCIWTAARVVRACESLNVVLGEDVDIVSFEQAMARVADLGNKHLVLGNGFSISLKPDIFTYGSLLESADFGKAPHVKALFAAIGTQDFEFVIKHLIDAARVISVYDPGNKQLIDQLMTDASIVKDTLVAAIARRHPDRPYDIDAAQYQSCRKFLSSFNNIYTMNYDVMLYSTIMNSDIDQIVLNTDEVFAAQKKMALHTSPGRKAIEPIFTTFTALFICSMRDRRL